MLPRHTSPSICLRAKKVLRKTSLLSFHLFTLLLFLLVCWISRRPIYLPPLHASSSPSRSPDRLHTSHHPLLSFSLSLPFFSPSSTSLLSSFFDGTEKEEGGGHSFFSPLVFLPVSAESYIRGNTDLFMASKDGEDVPEGPLSSSLFPTGSSLKKENEEKERISFPSSPLPSSPSSSPSSLSRPPSPSSLLSFQEQKRQPSRLLSSLRATRGDDERLPTGENKGEKNTEFRNEVPLSSQYTRHELELIEGMKSNIFYIMNHGSMPSRYPTYKEACLMLYQLLQTYDRSLISKHIIGHSVEGRPIVVYRVGGLLKRRERRRKEERKENKGDRGSEKEKDGASARRYSSLHEENVTNGAEKVFTSKHALTETDGASSRERGEKGEMEMKHQREFPEILVTGLHHAREPLSMLMCLYLIARLLRDYHLGDAEAKYLMSMREFWVLPILNPDGYVAVEVTGNREIRKNRRPLSSSRHFRSRLKGLGLDVNYKPENDGIDLNRNYAFHFPNSLPEESEDYGGPYPFSEPETAAVKFLVEQYRRHLPPSPSLSPSSRTLQSTSQLPMRDPEEAQEEAYKDTRMERMKYPAAIERSQRSHDLEETNFANREKDRRRLREEEEEAHSDMKKMNDEEADDQKTSSILTSLGRFEAALNFHTYGELWTRPFNCCKNWPLPLWAEKAFVELQKSLSIRYFNSAPNLPLLGYPADGEADDWLLHEHHVLSMSPEIGWEEGGFWQDYSSASHTPDTQTPSSLSSSLSNLSEREDETTRRKREEEEEERERINSERWFEILELNYARIATVGFKAGAELNLSLAFSMLSDASLMERRKNREGGEKEEEEEGKKEEEEEEERDVSSSYRRGGEGMERENNREGRYLQATESRVRMREDHEDDKRKEKKKKKTERRKKKHDVEMKEKNFNEVVSNGYDDLLPLSHRQFVRASLRQGEEGGGNNAGLRRPSHSKSYRVLTIQITNTGLLPFLSSSSNPAYIALSGLPLFPSLSSSSSSTSKFMNVEKEAHLALSPVTSHLESFFTGSRFKYSFSSKATRASSNRRRLHGLSSLHSSSSSASKILKERGEEEEERRKATHGGLLSASSSSYLRESSVGDFSQASDRRLAANGDFPSVTSQGDLSKTSGENADLSLQKDPQKSEGGNERRREEPSLKRPLGISLENEEKENKGEKEKEIHEKERPNVFAFSDDWKSHLPAYAMWTESTTTRGAGGLGDTKKTSKEEEEEREERNFEDSSAHSLPSPPVILVEISKELHGRNRESRGQAGMLQLHLLIPLKEEEDLYMGQEREETSKSSSILASPSSAAVSACILEPPPSFLPSKKFLSSESRLKDEKSHPRGLKEDKNEMIDDGEDFFFCHCGARVWSEEKDSPHSQDLSTQKERRDRMKHKRQQEEALWLPFPLSIEDSRSNGTCASGLLAVNELERRRRNEKVSKRKKEKNSSSEEKKQNRLSSQQSPGVGLHPLSNSHLFSRSPSSVVDSSGVSTPQGPPHPSPPLRGGERESSREKMQVEKGEQDKKDELEEKLSRVSLSSFSSSPRVRKDELPTSSGDERKKLSLGPKTAKGDEGDLEKDQRRSEYKPYLAFLRSFSSGEDMVPCPLFYANRKFFIPFALLMLLVLIVVLLLAIHKRCIKICREGVVFVGVKQRIKLLGLWCKDQIHFLCCCLHMFFKRSRDRTSGVQLILIDEESSSTSTGRNSRHDRRGKSSSRQNLSKSAEGRGGQRHSRQHLSYSSSSSRGRSITSHTYPKQQEHPPHRQQRDGRPVFRQEVSPGLEREEDVFPETLDLPPQPSFSDYDGHLESPGYHASSHRTFFPLSGYPQQHEGGQILSQSQSAYEKIKKGRQAERQEKRELLPAVVGRHQHHHYDLP